MNVYPEWLVNILMVPKKDGNVKIYVDHNKASPKDDFSLLHINVLVDNTARHALFSFVDSFLDYNQTRMAPEDRAKTSFITPWVPSVTRSYPLA